MSDATNHTRFGYDAGVAEAEVIPPRTAAREKAIERVEKLANFMDSGLSIFGFRFGFDSIIGLIPGIGDAAAAAVSIFIIFEAARLGVRKRVLMRMIANSGLDLLFGSVPVAGDVFDAIFKANNRNVRMMKKDLARLG